ncbi:MAG: GNAT family N-acetyltransferase [Myxococcales bacterium]|nr:GNAT family N-acetyltransferase [Myxococcales bacterium]
MHALVRRRGRADELELLYGIMKRALREATERMFGPWDETLQRQMFFRSTKPEQHELVLLDGEVVGYLLIERAREAITLQRITLLPEVQKRGLGTQLIREVMTEAAAQRVPLRLQVFPDNPARRLYARLGFVEIGASETHVQMQWRPLQ